MDNVCTKCSGNPVYFRRYSGERLCSKCFSSSIIEKTRKTIKKHKMLKYGEKIAVGVSGGKDSLAVLDILMKMQRENEYELVAITIDEGIKNYREEAVELAIKACEKYDVEHVNMSFRELFGFTLDNVLENRTVDNKKNDEDLFNIKNKTIGQIKNIVQEKKQTEKSIFKSSNQTKLLIKNFEDLINLCSSKKEIKLKHELETNVNLVSFENKRIEISFNEKLDKEFIKNLSTKLYEWTNDRWIISLSKENGEPSKKEKEILLKNELLEKAKKSEVYKKVLEVFPDAELINIEKNVEQNND